MDLNRLEWILKYELGEVEDLPPNLTSTEQLIVRIIEEGDKCDCEGMLSGVGENVEGKTFNIEGADKVAGEHAERFNDYERNIAIGTYSHVEGSINKAIGDSSHAEGNGNTASGNQSHAEGNGNTASGNQSHAEGGLVTAKGNYSHAEGAYTTAEDVCSHAEGNGTTASGQISHAEGYSSRAEGECSHAEGRGTIAKGYAQHVQGKFNIVDESGKFAAIIGNGTDDARHNAIAIDWNGLVYIGDDTENGIDLRELVGRVEKLETVMNALLNPMTESEYSSLTPEQKTAPFYCITED